jgi:hypothetical protein
MSRKIEELTKLVDIILSACSRRSAPKYIKEKRIEASKRIASVETVDKTTVSDKFIRGLREFGVHSTGDFDKKLIRFIKLGDDEIYRILLKACDDQYDIYMVNKTFNKHG